MRNRSRSSLIRPVAAAFALTLAFSALPTPAFAAGRADHTVVEFDTGIKADCVANEAGYMSFADCELTDAAKKYLEKDVRAQYEAFRTQDEENASFTFESYLKLLGYTSLEAYFADKDPLTVAVARRDGRSVMPYMGCRPYGEPAEELYRISDGVIAKNNTDPYVLSVDAYKTGRYGYYDLNGNRLFDIPYQFGKEFVNGVAFVRTATEEQRVSEDGEEINAYQTKAYLIDKTGRPILDAGKYFSDVEGMGDGMEGLALIGYYGSFGGYSEGLIGFSNSYPLKNTIFERDPDGVFLKNTAPCGYCDLQGNIVIPQKYAAGYPFYGGLAAVQEGEIKPVYYYYDENWELERTETPKPGIEADRVETEMVPGKFGFIDQTGATVIPFMYDSAMRFYGDFAVVSQNGKYGIIDKQNRAVVPFQYDEMSFVISDGKFTAIEDGKLYIRTLSGDTVFTLELKDVSDYSAFVDGVLYYIKDRHVHAVCIDRIRALGDADGDGKISAADARLALRAAVELDPAIRGTAPFLAKDADGDGTVTAADARSILRAAVGLEVLKEK